eukprot:scaffold141226_cov386-Phaeocystis_antarctica.AAC.1
MKTLTSLPSRSITFQTYVPNITSTCVLEVSNDVACPAMSMYGSLFADGVLTLASRPRLAASIACQFASKRLERT